MHITHGYVFLFFFVFFFGGLWFQVDLKICNFTNKNWDFVDLEIKGCLMSCYLIYCFFGLLECSLLISFVKLVNLMVITYLSVSPSSSQYIKKINKNDADIITFSLTGSHGDGHPTNTDTPLVVWGAGVQHPKPISETNHSDCGFLFIDEHAHDMPTPSEWGLNGIERVDVNQADIAPLMVVLNFCL